MSRWWRAYDEALHDPKLIALSNNLFRNWFNLMCISSKNGGILPPISIVATELRVSKLKAELIVSALIESKLLDQKDGQIQPHNWERRQYKSDASTERVKRFRNAKRNVSETPPETDNRDRQQKEDTASAVPSADNLEIPETLRRSKYAFESGVIRLSEKDFQSWKASFSYLDVPAELLQLTEFAQNNSDKWFFAVQGALAKRNRAAKSATQKPVFRTLSGMEGII